MVSKHASDAWPNCDDSGVVVVVTVCLSKLDRNFFI